MTGRIMYSRLIDRPHRSRRKQPFQRICRWHQRTRPSMLQDAMCPKRHLDRFSRFYGAQGRDQHMYSIHMTRQTHRQTTLVTNTDTADRQTPGDGKYRASTVLRWRKGILAFSFNTDLGYRCFVRRPQRHICAAISIPLCMLCIVNGGGEGKQPA